MSTKWIAILAGILLCYILGYFSGKRTQIRRMVPRFHCDFETKYTHWLTINWDYENKSYYDIIKATIENKNQECKEYGVPDLSKTVLGGVSADTIISDIIYLSIHLDDGKVFKSALDRAFGFANDMIEDKKKEKGARPADRDQQRGFGDDERD